MFSIFTFFVSTASAVTIVKPWSNPTEASYECAGGRCVSEAPKSNLMLMCEEMASRAAWAKDWQCLNTARFDNGSTVESIIDLRKKRNLTPEEEAILKASDKSGSIVLCNKAGGNAFLIMYQGRPAVITSAHLAVNDSDKSLKCTDKEMQNPKYFPNPAYFDPANPKKDMEFYTRSVDLEYPPVNLSEALVNIRDPKDEAFNDYMIFFLKEDITKDTMPAGHQRSYYQVAERVPNKGNGLMALGFKLDPDMHSHSLAYHSGCNFNQSDRGMRINHDCNSISGASGSVLGIMQNGEVAFAGLIHGSRLGETQISGPSRFLEQGWNYGVSSSVVYSD